MLQDWNITVKVVYNKDSDCTGEVDVRAEYREAVIRIYPHTIDQMAVSFPAETVDAVLRHEFGHIFIDDCFVNLGDEVTENGAFQKGEEILAERVAKLVEGKISD